MNKNTLNGYKPNIFQRLKYNLISGFNTIISNYNVWKYIVFKNMGRVGLSELLFYHWLTSNVHDNRLLPVEDFHFLKTFLRQEGFKVNMIGGVAPFIIDATHKSGVHLYFRSRGNTSLKLSGYSGNDDDKWFENIFYESYLNEEYMDTENLAFQGFYFLYSDEVRDLLKE